MNDHSVIPYLDRRYTITARVCIALELFKGIGCNDLAQLIGVNPNYLLRTVLTPLVRSGDIGKTIRDKHVFYHYRLGCAAIVAKENKRLQGDHLVNELRQHPRIKLDKLDKLLGIVPDVEE